MLNCMENNKITNIKSGSIYRGYTEFHVFGLKYF